MREPRANRRAAEASRRWRRCCLGGRRTAQLREALDAGGPRKRGQRLVRVLERRPVEAATGASHAMAGAEALHGMGLVASSLRALSRAPNAELTGRQRVDALPARCSIDSERLAGKVASRWRSG